MLPNGVIEHGDVSFFGFLKDLREVGHLVLPDQSGLSLKLTLEELLELSVRLDVLFDCQELLITEMFLGSDEPDYRHDLSFILGRDHLFAFGVKDARLRFDLLRVADWVL